MPEMKVTKPSSMAARISRSRAATISDSGRESFSGRCPVKQQLWSRVSDFISNANTSLSPFIAHQTSPLYYNIIPTDGDRI